jgi:hypothetical protein
LFLGKCINRLTFSFHALNPSYDDRRDTKRSCSQQH